MEHPGRRAVRAVARVVLPEEEGPLRARIMGWGGRGIGGWKGRGRRWEREALYCWKILFGGVVKERGRVAQVTLFILNLLDQQMHRSVIPSL